MPLKITLKPNEKVIIGTAVISNGHSKSELVIHNRVPVVRQKDLLSEEEANTPAKKIYLIILNMYLNPDKEVSFHDFYSPLLHHIVGMSVDERGINLSTDMSKRIVEGDYYKALKICKKLIEYEAEVTRNGARLTQSLPEHTEGRADTTRGGGDGLHQSSPDVGRREEEF
jgi:flagellar protein FlbT